MRAAARLNRSTAQPPWYGASFGMYTAECQKLPTEGVFILPMLWCELARNHWIIGRKVLMKRTMLLSFTFPPVTNRDGRKLLFTPSATACRGGTHLLGQSPPLLLTMFSPFADIFERCGID